MQKTPTKRSAVPAKRTLESLAADYKAFNDAGAVTANAKLFHNVIRPAVLPIPIEDVCIPALHLDLGIFPYLYYAFVDELRCIDFQMATVLFSGDRDSQAYQRVVESFQEVVVKEHERASAKEDADMYGAQVQ